jgi:TfoX/Sxy family transcriptional regulator of competence genes
MPTKQDTVDDILSHLAAAGRVTARKMFGEYCVYLNDKPVALVCDDTFYLKPTDVGRQLLPGAAEGPPYPGAKPHLLIPAGVWADPAKTAAVVKATFQALPPSKAKKGKK